MKYRSRAALADSLWASLDHEVDEDAWREEIRRRLQEIDSGAVKLIHWPDVRRELLDRLGSVRFFGKSGLLQYPMLEK
jgi:putative addiction module component (TIGR02574 family)